MHTSERNAYTLFTLLGDVGGFNGAIIIFPTYLMSWYASRMFVSSIAADMPMKKKKKHKANQASDGSRKPTE